MSSENEILKRWLARDERQRTWNEAEKLADEDWELGLRLARSPRRHDQYVMNLVRWSIQE